MIIREYKSEDRVSCIQVFNSNVPRYFAERELVEFEDWLNEFEVSILNLASSKSDYYYIIEVSEKMIGCGGFYIDHDKSNAILAWGMIENNFHRRGIGSKFLEYRLNKIRLISPSAIISLDTTQYSYKFFEKFGFRVIKVTKDFYSKGLDRYDMVG